MRHSTVMGLRVCRVRRRHSGAPDREIRGAAIAFSIRLGSRPATVDVSAVAEPLGAQTPSAPAILVAIAVTAGSGAPLAA